MVVRRRPRAERQSVRYQGYRRRGRARHAGTGGGRNCRRQGRIPGMVAVDAAGSLRHPEEGLGRNPGAQGRIGPAAVARGRQDLAGRRRRSGARWADFCVLCRRMPADGRRETRFRAPRRRHRDHPRRDRRRRPDHAVEFPDRDPGLEDCAGTGLWQHRGDQAGRPRPRLDLGAGRHPASRRPAQGRAQPRASGAARKSAPSCSNIRTSRPSASPARFPPARRSRRPASRRGR